MKKRNLATYSLPLVLAVLLGAVAPSAFAAGKEKKSDEPGKILFFVDVETVDTRADKRFKEPNLPRMSETALPYSQSDLAKMPADRLERAEAANDAVRRQNFEAKQTIAWQRYVNLQSRQKALINKYQGTEFGRHIFVARDWFASALMEEYGEYFSVIHRMDMDKAEFEKAIKDDTGDEVAGQYLAIVILADPMTKTKEMVFPGDVTVARTICTLQATIEIQELDGRVVYSKTVEGSANIRESNSYTSSGSDDLVGKAIRDALKKAGSAVGDYFICDVTIEVKGPKGDEDFEPDDVDIEVDGVSYSNGDDVTVLKGTSHTIEASYDGYCMKSKNTFKVKKSKTIKVVMEKEVPAEAADADSDEEE